MHRTPLPSFRDCVPTEPLSEAWPSFVVYTYASDAAYDAWDGEDWTPWTRARMPSFATHNPFVGPIGRLVPSPHPEVRHAQCEFDDGWRVQRVGPFFASANGTRWWQMAGRNLLGLDPPARVAESMLGVVDTEGRVRGDLHVHHIHATFADPRGAVGDAFPPMYRYHHRPVKFLEHHQESNFCEPDVGCFAESEPSGFARLLHTPLDVDLEINQLSSSVQEPFYVQFAVRLVREARAVSFLQMGSIGGHVYGHQFTYGDYFWLPAKGRYVTFNHAVVPEEHVGARLLYAKHHSHVAGLDRKFLLRNAQLPEALVHHEPSWWRVAGHMRLRELAQLLLFGGATPADDWGTELNFAYLSEIDGHTLPLWTRDFDEAEASLRRHAAPVCTLRMYPVHRDGREYDVADRHCAPNVTLEQGDVLSVVSFLELSPDAHPFGGRLTMHDGWFLGLAAPSPHVSCFTYGTYATVCTDGVFGTGPLFSPAYAERLGAHVRAMRGAAVVVAMALGVLLLLRRPRRRWAML